MNTINTAVAPWLVDAVAKIQQANTLVSAAGLLRTTYARGTINIPSPKNDPLTKARTRAMMNLAGVLISQAADAIVANTPPPPSVALDSPAPPAPTPKPKTPPGRPAKFEPLEDVV